MSANTGDFAAIAITLYAAHHVGDYWVQRDEDAQYKGDTGWLGRAHCLEHVCSYVATQALFCWLTMIVLDVPIGWLGSVLGLLVSGVTHYIADRREHGLMFWLARRIPGKADFLRLGKPRQLPTVEYWEECSPCGGTGIDHDESTGGLCCDCRGGGKLPVPVSDNPQLATGAWALDQAWHIFWGVFVAALIMAGLS